MDMTYATIPIFNQTRRLCRKYHMQYMVSSQDRPEKSPLYSVHTGLDSFILFNHEISNEQETLIDLMAIPHCNIVTDTEKEEDKTKLSRQFAKSKNYSKLITGLGLQNNHPLVVNFES